MTISAPTLILYLLIVVLALWSAVLTALILKQNNFFAAFTQGIAKNDLKTILKNIAGSMKKIGEEINRLDGEVNTIIKQDERHLQKVGFVRYNPFSDTGGDQSFCLCILDQNDNGVVMTSLHSREQTRIYAKVVAKGTAKGYEFSKEEKEAVQLALQRRRL